MQINFYFIYTFILFQLCIDFMMNNIDESNACENMHTAVTYRQDVLQERTMKYIEENTQVGMQTLTLTVIIKQGLLKLKDCILLGNLCMAF